MFKTRFFKYALAIPLSVSFFLLLFFCGFVSWKLTHPERSSIRVYPEEFSLPYRSVEFKSAYDEKTLKGWLIPAKKGGLKSIVVFAHGYGDNRSNNEAPLTIAQNLRETGIASLLFDFRNSGESDKGATTLGFYEKKDIEQAVRFAKSAGYEKIGLLGFSMGASAALDAAAETPEVNAVVADSPFSDLVPFVENALPSWTKLPKYPFAPLVILESSVLTGSDPFSVNPAEAASKLSKKPLLLIHAKGDPLIPSSNSEAILSAKPGDKELWITKGGEHTGSFFEAPNIYSSKIADFFMSSMAYEKDYKGD